MTLVLQISAGIVLGFSGFAVVVTGAVYALEGLSKLRRWNETRRWLAREGHKGYPRWPR